MDIACPPSRPSTYPSTVPFLRSSPYYRTIALPRSPGDTNKKTTISTKRLVRDLAKSSNGFDSKGKLITVITWYWPDSGVYTYGEAPSTDAMMRQREEAGMDNGQYLAIPSEMRVATRQSSRSLIEQNAAERALADIVASKETSNEDAPPSPRSPSPLPHDAYPNLIPIALDRMSMQYEAVPFTSSTSTSSLSSYYKPRRFDTPLPAWTQTDTSCTFDEAWEQYFDFTKVEDVLQCWEGDEGVNMGDEAAAALPVVVESSGSSGTPPVTPLVSYTSLQQDEPVDHPTTSASGHQNMHSFAYMTPGAATPSLMVNTGSTAYSDCALQTPSTYLPIPPISRDTPTASGSGMVKSYHLSLPPAFTPHTGDPDVFTTATAKSRSASATSAASIQSPVSQTRGMIMHHTATSFPSTMTTTKTTSMYPFTYGPLTHLPPGGSSQYSSLEVLIDGSPAQVPDLRSITPTPKSKERMLQPYGSSLPFSPKWHQRAAAAQAQHDAAHQPIPLAHETPMRKKGKRLAPYMKRNLKPAAQGYERNLASPGSALVWSADRLWGRDLGQQGLDVDVEPSGSLQVIEHQPPVAKKGVANGKGKAKLEIQSDLKSPSKKRRTGKKAKMLQTDSSSFRGSSPPTLFDREERDTFGAGMSVDDKRGILGSLDANSSHATIVPSSDYAPSPPPYRFLSPDSTPTRLRKIAERRKALELVIAGEPKSGIDGAIIGRSSTPLYNVHDGEESMSDTDTEDQTPKKRRKMRAVSLVSAADGYDGANSKAAPQLQGHKAKEVPGTATGTLHPNLAGFRRAGGDEAEEGSSTKFGSNEGKKTKFKAPTPLRASTSSIGHSLTDIKHGPADRAPSDFSSQYHKGPAEGLRRKRAQTSGSGFIAPTPTRSTETKCATLAKTTKQRSVRSVQPAARPSKRSVTTQLCETPSRVLRSATPFVPSSDRVEGDDSDGYTNADAEGEDEDFSDAFSGLYTESSRSALKRKRDASMKPAKKSDRGQGITGQKGGKKPGKMARKMTAQEMVQAGQGSTHAWNGRGYTEAELQIMIPHWDGQSALGVDILNKVRNELVAAGYKKREPTALKWYMKNTLHPRILEYAAAHPAEDPLPPSKRRKTLSS